MLTRRGLFVNETTGMCTPSSGEVSTYSTPDGGQEEVGNYTGDWDKVFENVQPGTFLYVSAQNQHDSGDVTCTLFVDGQQVQTHTSTGAYVIVTCDGPNLATSWSTHICSRPGKKVPR